MSDRQLGVLLACFDGTKGAGKARRGLAAQLRSQGDVILDTVVLEVDAKHKASDHDPHRVVWGTVTPALMWGLFGLALGSDGLTSALVWAVLGAVCGGLYNYYVIRHLTKSDLARIGTDLPANSSALALFVETADAERLLEAADGQHPSVASVAAIDNDLTTRVVTRPELGESPSDRTAVLNMIMLRYPSTETAKQMATKIAADGKGATSPLEVELVIRTGADGRRRVADPKFGVAAAAKSDVISWGGFGLVLGAIAGAVDGGGALGFLEGGLSTAIVWGLFGLAAGALYGFVAGRVVSGRTLRSVGPLLPPDTSMVLAWAGPITTDDLRALITPESQQLVLHFNAVERGAVLEAA